MPKYKTPEELSANALEVLKLIPIDGSPVGNTFLRKRLGWPDDQYWDARKELLENKLIRTGKGRGGSVSLALAAGAPEVEEELEEIGELVENESDLYEPLKGWVESTYGHPVEEEGDYFLVKATGSPSGYKRESGPWSRPDVVSVQVTNYDLLPGPEVEVTSYEVKRYSDATSLSSIFEAASHSRWAHFAYLVVEDSKDKPLVFSERFEKELARFGVGLVKMRKDNGGYKFEETSEPTYEPPEAEDLDELIASFFRGDEKNLKKYKSAIRK